MALEIRRLYLMRKQHEMGSQWNYCKVGCSGVNNKLVNRISFRLGRNDEIRKEY